MDDFESGRIERDVGDFINSIEGMSAWIDLEQALIQQLESDTESSTNSEDDDRHHHDNASPCHEISMPAAIIFSGGEVVDDLEVQTTRTANEHAEAIPHDDIEGITSDNAVVLTTTAKGDDDDSNAPRIYPIYQSQPPITEDIRGVNQSGNQSEIVSVGKNAENESADTDRPQRVDEELVNMETIQTVLNNDVDEILSENVVSATSVVNEGEDVHSVEDNEEDGNDANAHEEIRPGAQHIYPSQRSTEEDSHEDDASDVVYDLFDRPPSPYVAEVIPSAVPVDLDSFDYCANVKSAAVPLRATSITSELRNKDALLRRQSLVDDIISKLQDSSVMNASDDCDESQNVVLLRGDGGIGKSVLCSMVVSNRSTLLHFADGIAWLSLSKVRGEGARGGMTYDLYVKYLESICNQLDLEVPSFDEPIALASDSSSVLRRKEQAAMEAAKDAMCRLLSNRHVLLVLDDVWSRSAIPWLNFSNRLDSHLRVLLSTRLRGGFRKAKVIDIGELSLQEARTLLLRESGCGHAALTIEEESLAFDIVNRCSLPIAICIAGRRLSSANNRYEAFQELANDMSDALALHIDSHDAMFDLTDRCFVGVNGESLKASFVAFSAIFTTNEGKRRFVSAAAATKLLDALLLPEDITDLACVNGTVSILQRLHDMGLLERKENMFTVHHDSLQEYTKQIMRDKRERAILFTRRLSRCLGKRLATKSTKSVEKLVSTLHHLFARQCISNVNIESCWQSVADDGYIFQRLPWHVMSSSHRKSYVLARNVLCSPLFLKRRVAAMDILPCIKAHIHDIEMLEGNLHTKDEKKALRGFIDEAFEVIIDYIATEGVDPNDSARVCMLLALYFQHHFRFSNAMEMYSRAYATFQREGLEEEVDWVKKRAEKIAFKPVCLVPKSAASENIIRFDKVELILAQQDNAVSQQESDMDSGSIVSTYSGIKLTLSSHPGMALCLSDKCQHYPWMDFRNLCIGPAESAVSVKYEGGRFVGCHGGNSCLTTGASRGGEGDMLHMAFCRYSNKTLFRKILSSMYGKTITSDLIVNEDGTLSPMSRRDLVFAVRSPQLFLVKRDSPCRLVFKHGRDMKRNQAPTTSQDCAVSLDKVFSGELFSHPGNAICHDVEIKVTSKILGDQMKVCGDVAGSVQFVYDGKKLGAVVDGKCKYFLINALGIGGDSVNLYLVRDESKGIFKHEFEFGLHWIINDDGSLSPAQFPTHSIGIHCLSSNELFLTEEQHLQAKSAAKGFVRTHRGQSLKHSIRFLRLIL